MLPRVLELHGIYGILHQIGTKIALKKEFFYSIEILSRFMRILGDYEGLSLHATKRVRMDSTSLAMLSCFLS